MAVVFLGTVLGPHQALRVSKRFAKALWVSSFGV